MKGRRGNRREHLVPLSRQASALFQAQHAISGPSGFVFQSQRTATGFISNNTVNMAFKRIEKNKVTAAYNRAEYWPQRVEMRRWADLLNQVG